MAPFVLTTHNFTAKLQELPRRVIHGCMGVAGNVKRAGLQVDGGGFYSRVIDHKGRLQ